MSDQRCAWARGASELMRAYHDEEWGRPSRDDAHLFEMLVLEGAQAGLSWATVLNKRENYRRALDGFDPDRIADYGQEETDRLLRDAGIIRNRLKVASLPRNAQAFQKVRAEYGTFADYLWGWVDGSPVVNRFTEPSEVPASTPLSDRVSKDLRKRGFTFVGTTIVYSYLQSAGLVEDHLVNCPAKPA
ncbi:MULTISPECIES: DNA-3-methyladenine glycosylase I [Nocardiopsis]|uniref:DNA-3-methyladenine glycosylase n=1 Tax=Nocardiopsis sinuspersici TaxID=501010 RepID=A0A1V3C667_9ACTN|nr:MULTISPECIES: DNA-3-methyladenine glycosylase I [Nocardiopsis]OOC56284.1 DNA-3-methyladenine glycosylase [Nocardiopsis sinuspersici]